MLPKTYIRSVLEYTVGAPVSTGSIDTFNKVIERAYNGGAVNNDLIKKFKQPLDLLDYVKDNLIRKPNKQMLALYESTVDDIMTIQTERCFKSATFSATNAIILYTALGLISKQPPDVFKLDLMGDIKKLVSGVKV
jgi:hypothetical protein